MPGLFKRLCCTLLGHDWSPAFYTPLPFDDDSGDTRMGFYSKRCLRCLEEAAP